MKDECFETDELLHISLILLVMLQGRIVEEFRSEGCLRLLVVRFSFGMTG